MERGGREAAGRFLDFVPVLARDSEGICFMRPGKGATMDQIANWIQNNWYEMGSLVAQFTFLFAGLWFAGKILRTMRATEQQMGALLRLSMAGGLEERSKMSEIAHEVMNEGVHDPTPSVIAGSMFSPAPQRPISHTAFDEPARINAAPPPNGSNGRVKASEPIATALIAEAPMASTEEPTPYAAAPLTLPEGEHNEGHLAAAVQWLQTPMANKRKSSSPLKKVVRWLQAPAR